MHRYKNANAIPFVVAIQALLFFLMGFFQTPVPGASEGLPGAGGDSTQAPDTLTSLSELPRDLQRERLPIPRFPERAKPDEPPTPTPENDAPPMPGAEGSKLASLRIGDVPLTGPVAIAISAPMLGLPDSLEGQSLAGGNWLGGRSSGRARSGRAGGPSDMGGGGMGGQGVGGYGSGGGGHCPTPGRIGGYGGGRGGGGGTVRGGGPGRPAGGGGGAVTGTPSGGSRGTPAGKGGGRTKGKGRSGK